MVVTRFDTFFQWLLPNADQYGAAVYAALMLAGGTLFCLLVGYLVAAFRSGLSEGFYSVATVVAGAIPDFLRLSPRRAHAGRVCRGRFRPGLDSAPRTGR